MMSFFPLKLPLHVSPLFAFLILPSLSSKTEACSYENEVDFSRDYIFNSFEKMMQSQSSSVMTYLNS